MKKNILPLILAITAQFSFAVAPDSLKRDLEDYDYLVSFVDPFKALSLYCIVCSKAWNDCSMTRNEYSKARNEYSKS